MFKKFNVAAAIATVAIASGALAASASAAEINAVQMDPDPVAHTFQFGNGCAAGLAPATDGLLHYRDNVAGTSGAPDLQGRLCLQNTTDQARMKVTYHDAAHNIITRFTTQPVTGTGGALDDFPVNGSGPRISYQFLTHVLVDIERNSGAGWVAVDRQIVTR